MKVFIGYDHRQPVASSVLIQSILEKTTEPVEITPLVINTLPMKRQGLTPFTYSRFMVPYLCQYKGPAIFLDADIMLRADLCEMMDLLDPHSAVMVVKHGEDRRYEWPSVMLFNCAHYAHRNLTPDFIENLANNPLKMDWLDEKFIGALPKEWNHLVGYDAPNPTAKLVHFTQGIPAFPETKGTEFADEWLACFHRVSSAESWDTLMGKSVHAKHVLKDAAKEPPKALKPLGNIIAKGAIDTVTRHDQMRTNLARPNVGRMEPADPHAGRIVIANYGPSLKDTWQGVAEAQKGGAKILSTSGAHDFLVERGVIPDFHAQCDPRPEPPQYVQKPQKGTTYLLASVVHPTVYEHLKDFTIKSWNLQNKPVDMEIVKECDPKGFLVVGGSTIGLTSLSLVRIMGYRTVDIHGMDSSCADGQRHAGHHGGKPQEIFTVYCGDRPFETTAQMVSQAREFFQLVTFINDLNLTIHGDGLLPQMLKEGMREKKAA